MLVSLEITVSDLDLGGYTLRDLRKVACDSEWVKDLISGTEGKVLRLILRMVLSLLMRNSPDMLRECSRAFE